MACVHQSVVALGASVGISAISSSRSSSSKKNPGQNLYGSPYSQHPLRLSVAGAANRDSIFGRPQRRWTCSSASSDEDVYLPDLQVPQAWVSPESAAQEAEWLRAALHKWLDEEYCPEAANDEISRRCAKVFYYCLLEKQLDVGDILMQMVRDLETFSFKESFHGAFSSANAAIDLITQKMRAREASSS